MTDLEKLIAAVEADADEIDMYPAIPDMEHRHWFAAAYNGSLDAALRLHEALLPGWVWEGGSFSNAMSVYPPFYPSEDFDAPCYSGENANLPRAWLLAILRALAAHEQRKGEG